MANLKNTTVNDTEFFKLPVGGNSQRTDSEESGALRYNTVRNIAEIFNGEVWLSTRDSFPEATGGKVIDSIIDGINYRIHAFTVPGSENFQIDKSGLFDVLVVAGGGAGGNGYYSGGGGGGGVVFAENYELSKGSYNITVGAGGSFNNNNGSRGQNGNNSEAFGISAIGGGGGAGRSDGNGSDGGSGGGAARPNEAGGTALQPGNNSNLSGILEFGNKGGNSGGSAYGASGGGAGEAGIDAPSDGIYGTDTSLGVCFSDIFSVHFGDSGFFAGGGGGGTRNLGTVFTKPGGGGIGGESSNHGQPGDDSRPGILNSGAGGGGGGDDSPFDRGAAGADGIVLIRYKKNPDTEKSKDRSIQSIQPFGYEYNRFRQVFKIDAKNPACVKNSISDIVDVSGHNTTSIQTQNVEFEQRNGGIFNFTHDPSASSIEFNSSDEYKIPLPLTIQAWVLLKQNISTQGFIFSNDLMNCSNWGPDSAPSEYNGVVLNIGSNNTVGFQWGDGNSCSSSHRRTTVSSRSLQPFVWYHISASLIDVGNSRLFINGEEDTNLSYSGSGGNTIGYSQNYGPRIGSSFQNGRVFPGEISEISLYNYQVSEQEVLQTYNSTKHFFGSA